MALWYNSPIAHVITLSQGYSGIFTRLLKTLDFCGNMLDTYPTRHYLRGMDLYHADIRLPEGFVSPTARVRLRWTEHANRARRDDRYGEIPSFTSLPLANFKVIEIGVENRRVVKMLVRGHYTKNLDICFVLIPGAVWTVKTVWMNERNDTHRTLDRSKYMR